MSEFIEAKCPACGAGMVPKECIECEGTALDREVLGDPCPHCDGTGQDEEWGVCPNGCIDPEADE